MSICLHVVTSLWQTDGQTDGRRHIPELHASIAERDKYDKMCDKLDEAKLVVVEILFNFSSRRDFLSCEQVLR